jgi:hypothetical protein
MSFTAISHGEMIEQLRTITSQGSTTCDDDASPDVPG